MDYLSIDSHQHFWRYDPNDFPWINGKMEVLQNDFMPMDLKPLLEDHNMDGCVVVQAAQSEEETDFLLACAEKYPFIKGVVGWLDLCAENIAERIEHYAPHHKLKGLRHIIHDEQDVRFMLRPDFLNGISLLQEYGLTYDILIFPEHLPYTLELVSMFPEQPFVIDHIAKPRINGKIDDLWVRHIEQLGQFDNVYCKISGMVTEAEWGQWHKGDFIPYMDVVLGSFGSERLMFGSDWPVCLLSGTYDEVVDIVENYTDNFNKEVRAKIMGQNAVQFYKL